MIIILANAKSYSVCFAIGYDEQGLCRGYSVRLNIGAKTMEIQRAAKGVDVKRARYNVSMMDANTLVKREEYENMEKREIALKMPEDGKLWKEEVVKYFGFTPEQAEKLVPCKV